MTNILESKLASAIDLFNNSKISMAILMFQDCLELKSGNKIEINRYLGRCYASIDTLKNPDNINKSITLLKENAEVGDSESCRYLAEIYGSNKLVIDPANSIRWYFNAIGNGDIESAIHMCELLISKEKDSKFNINDQIRTEVGLELSRDNAIQIKEMIISDFNPSDKQINYLNILIK
jgi:hypothetical protein